MSRQLGLLFLLEATLGSLKPLSEFLAAELSSLCQEGIVGMWWAVCPVGRWISPRFIQPHSQDTATIKSTQQQGTHLGTEGQQGTRNPLSPLPTCYLATHRKGMRAGSEGLSVLHLAGGLARRGAHLGNSSQKPLTLLCMGIGNLQQMGNEESARLGSTTA